MLTEYTVHTKSEGRFTVWAEHVEVIPEDRFTIYSHISFIDDHDVVARVRIDDIIRIIEVQNES